MTLKIALPPEEEKKLAERAAAIGKDVASYVHQLIQKDIEQASFAELFAPVHRAVRDSGMDESELSGLIQSAISESRREKQAKRAS
jgi:predicted DNA-binding protein